MMARQALPPQEGSKPSRWSILKATVGEMMARQALPPQEGSKPSRWSFKVQRCLKVIFNNLVEIVELLEEKQKKQRNQRMHSKSNQKRW